jgi:long-chain fatty acid transport protein
MHLAMRTIGLTVGLFFWVLPAWAGGLYLYELGTPDLGTAAAGRAALAQDASTVIGNPAGMSLLDRSQLTTSIQTILPSIQFDRRSGTTVSGGNGFNAGTTIPSHGSASIPVPAGSFFYVHNLSPDWKLGIGIGSGFGAGLNYGKEWVGRYYIQKSQLLTTTVNPGFSYRVNPWLSVGAGFSVNYVLFSYTTAINNLLDRLPDGRLKFKDDDIGFGGNVGILAELSDQTRFGLTYRSPVDFTYKDRLKLTNTGPLLSRLLDKKVALDQTAPQTVMVSGYHAITDRWAIMGNVGWQNWEQFGNVDVTVSSDTQAKSLTADSHFHDTWHAAIGSQYRIGTPWLLSLGFAYDSSPVSRFHRTPSMPLDETFRFATGLQYDWSQEVTVGVAYEFLQAGDAKIAHLERGPLAGALEGDYSSNLIHFVALNVTLKF